MQSLGDWQVLSQSRDSRNREQGVVRSYGVQRQNAEDSTAGRLDNERHEATVDGQQ